MTENSRASALELLLARQEIHELHATYMHAQDRLDPDLHRSVFHDDATTDYGSMAGSADDFVAWAQAALREMRSTHHMLGQARIEFEGDLALGEVYFQAHHRLVLDGSEMDLFIAGRYVDRYERRAGVWKIAHRASSPTGSAWSLRRSLSLRSIPRAPCGESGAMRTGRASATC